MLVVKLLNYVFSNLSQWCTQDFLVDANWMSQSALNKKQLIFITEGFRRLSVTHFGLNAAPGREILNHCSYRN